MIKTKRTLPLFPIVFTAVMVAASVILCRFLGFSPSNSTVRFDLGFLPLAVVGTLYGAPYSGVGYLLADIIGSLLHGYAPNPYISACKLLTGILMGVGFYKKKVTLMRSFVVFLINAVIVGVGLMPPIFIFMYAYEPGFAYATRAINAAVTVPVRVFTFYFLWKACGKMLTEMKERQQNFTFRRKKNKSEDFQAYANSFQAVTIPGLSRIKALLDALGNPEESLRFIHIAGTNGKGSVAADIASILTAAGYRVGKYTSPNLLRVNERISVAGVDIPDDALDALLERIRPLADRIRSEGGIPPTQFEIWTAAAFVYFKEEHCDYVVAEVGLGGEFDATNVIPRNEIAVITRLGMDHMQYLGNTLADIARAKCGILKADSTTHRLVTPEQDPEAMEVIRRVCEEKGVSLTVATPISEGAEGYLERFSVGNYRHLLTGIPGYPQIENAALAVLACDALGVSEEAIRKGLAAAKNPARFEILREHPTVIYDGGHNENGIRSLVTSLSRYFPGEKKSVIFACMADKEIDVSLSLLAEGTDAFFFTEVKDNPRALSAEDLAAKAETLGIRGTVCKTVGEAYEAALAADRLTVICGSLYLYRDLTDYLNKTKTK